MIKTLEDIRQQQRVLCEKCEDLGKLEIVPVREAFERLDFEGLAEFVEASWRDSYGERDRFDYDQDYLRWAIGEEGFDSDLSIAAREDGQLRGVFLHVKRSLIYRGKAFDTGIQTALSVDPKWKRRGVASLLHLAAQERCIHHEKAGTFFWYDSSLKERHTSHEIFVGLEERYFEYWGQYSLRALILDAERALENAHVKMYERPLVKMLSGSKGYGAVGRLEVIDERNSEEVRTYLNGKSLALGEGRFFSAAEFEKYSQFTGDRGNFKTFAIAFRNPSIKAVLIGFPHTIRGRNCDRVFFVDYVSLDGLSREEGRSFIKDAGQFIRERYDVYAIVSLHKKLGLRQRFLPLSTKLSCYSLPYDLEFVKSDAQDRALPIVDHK